MSYVELKEKTVVCRKDHYCEWCGESVVKGEKSLYRCYMLDNDFKSGYLHLECYSALHRWIDEVGEVSFEFGSMERGEIPSEFY